MLRVASALLCVLLIVTFARPADASPTHSRLRAIDARLLSLIQESLRRSATFAEMARRLQSSDVILYVVPARELPSDLLGRLMFVCDAGLVRYLRAEIHMRRTDTDLMAMIAHELQHALEIAADPEVRNEQGVRRLYARIGCSRRPDRFDTKAADEAGARVRSELLVD
jgi:hypothetical protein